MARLSFFTSQGAGGGLNLQSSARGIQADASPDLLNVDITRSGGIIKSNGYIKLNTSALPSKIQGLYDFVRDDGQKYRLVVSNGNLYRLNTDKTTTTLSSSLFDAKANVNFATFNNLCIMVNGLDAPQTYDGTAVAALSNWPGDLTKGTQPAFAEVWKNRLWFSGDDGRPYRVYHSEIGDPTGWTSTDGAGALDVNISDGQTVTGIKTFFNSLMFYKTNSIHQLTGDSAVGSGGINEFSIRPISDGLGCNSYRSIITVGTDQYFSSNDGFHSLRSTENFGDVATSLLTHNVLPLIEKLNETYAKNIFTVHHKRKNQLWLFFSTDSSSENDEILVYNYLLNSWTRRDGFKGSIGIYADGKPIIGDYDGFINKHDFGGNYAGGAIDAYWNSFHNPLGNYLINKRVRALDVTIERLGDWNLLIDTGWDYQGYTRRFMERGNIPSSFALWGVSQWGVGTWTGITSTQTRQLGGVGYGKVLQVKFGNVYADEPFHVVGWDIAYQIRGLRSHGRHEAIAPIDTINGAFDKSFSSAFDIT